MPLNDTPETVLEILEKVFANVNNWLLFAETKNGALIAFNIALMAVIVENMFAESSVVVYLIMIGICLSSICSLISFIPYTGNINEGNGIRSTRDNLLLYSHIAKYTKEEYLKALYKKYKKKSIKTDEMSKIELDYADEITYNASIMARKYEWFRNALKIDFAVIVVLIIYVVKICFGEYLCELL